MLHSLVAPVVIRAASVCILSRVRFFFCFFFSTEQLSQIMFAYSRRGRIWVRYILLRESLSNTNLLRHNVPILFHTAEVIAAICWCHVPSSEKVSSKCLCDGTSFISMLFIKREGWRCLFFRLVIIKDIVLLGLNLTNHFPAEDDILVNSLLRRLAAVIGSSTMTNKLVSSAKSLMFAFISFTMSLI